MGTVEVEEEASAIRALGSLFKLTEAHLWVDGSEEIRVVPIFDERSSRFQGKNLDSSSNGLLEITDISSKEVELIKEMKDLGLPLSFQTNKEWKNKARGRQKKGTHVKSASGRKEAKDELQDPVASKVDSESFSCLSTPCQIASSYRGVAVDVNYLEELAGEEGNKDLPDQLSFCDRSADVLFNEGCHSGSSVSVGVLSEEDKDVASNLNSMADVSSVSYLTSGSGNGDMEADIPLQANKCVQRTSSDSHLGIIEKCCSENGTDNSMVSEPTTNSESLASHSNITENLDSSGDSRDWKVYWDSFYGQNYFHNVKTQESTWLPPPGMEHLAYSNHTHNLNELALEVIETDTCRSHSLSSEISGDFGVLRGDIDLTETFASGGKTSEKSHDGLLFRTEIASDAPIGKSEEDVGACRSQNLAESLEEVGSLNDNSEAISYRNPFLEIHGLAEEMKDADLVNSIAKERKRTRQSRTKKIVSTSRREFQSKGILEEYSANIGKYWCQRYLLFSKFDEGIKMDEEGWFSVTPELIAKHHATRCKGGTVIDCFTGVGGNAIQFALRSNFVIAIDVDPEKLDLAHHNAAIYGVVDKIDFVKGDFFQLAHKLKADTVFLSPPWGGPDYAKASTYDITMLKPRDGGFLFNSAKNIASTVVMFLPRNINVNQLAELALSTYPSWSLEVEKNYLNGRLKAITAYFRQQQQQQKHGD